MCAFDRLGDRGKKVTLAVCCSLSLAVSICLFFLEEPFMRWCWRYYGVQLFMRSEPCDHHTRSLPEDVLSYKDLLRHVLDLFGQVEPFLHFSSVSCILCSG